jgi:hypothetical protein
MKLPILLCLILIAVTACGSDVAPDTGALTLQSTEKALPTSTSLPVSPAIVPAVAQAVAETVTQEAIEYDDSEVRECLTALAVISGWHEHSASVTVSTMDQFYEGAPLQGWADVRAPEFKGSYGEGFRNSTFTSDLQPVALLDRHCGGVIDIGLAESLIEEISALPKPK